ncbi:unannotated protein [freshwater metagenome]|uniref:Unannotated protein n=1 Tax=freshwater metagenome TaxID=449393 RepID=A0A6J6Q426_9ZZZZ
MLGTGMNISERFDLRALWNGATTAAMIAVPVQVIARLAVDEDRQSGWSVLLTLLILGALVLGAGVAAWHQQRSTPLSHGVLTSSGVFITVQIVFSVIKVIQGDSISWGRIVVSLGLSLVAGICGGMLGSIMLRRGTVPRR